MKIWRVAAGSLSLLVLLSVAAGQAPVLPVLDNKPTPLIDAGEPSAAVTALAFSADGETLYAAGLDKVVRGWTLRKGRFVKTTGYRVPLGPGNAGGINALALSPDGAWIALAGRAPMRGEVGFRRGGVIVEAASLSVEQNQDAGVIYVASTSNPAGGKVLRGHQGEVRALAFAPASPGKPPLLVSAATERAGAKRFGGLCLWDVAAGKLLAQRAGLPERAVPPGLAVWHTGAAPTQVRVVVAWPEEEPGKEGRLRLWDPSPKADPLQVWKNDAYSQTAALLGAEDSASVLVGGLGPKGGRLQVWQIGAERDTRVRLGKEFPFSPHGQVHYLPVSLTVFSASGGAATTHAAVILQPSSPKEDFHLAVIDLRDGRIGAIMPLKGSDKERLPVVAARGVRIAVAAARDHAVRVYELADLLEGKTEPAAVLGGDGLAPRQVAFLAKGRGLWLSEDGQAKPLSDGLYFDLDKRQVGANDRADLVADTPALGLWSFVLDRDEKGVSVRQGNRELPPVRLHGKDEKVTAAALRPPAPGQPGVLAVAYTERDASRTLILLCDPENGKPYRLLVSHLQDVRSLAFSASRPLLASVADDQTVCVWSLADLDRAVGQVAGLGVGDAADKKVVVRRVEPNSAAAQAKLAESDVVEKVGVPGGPARPIRDAAGFLLDVSARTPGDQVEVTVAGKGVVKLPVERGVDERKPLFSLLLLRAPRLPDWIGWSPAGPYDYSSPAAEAHLGWHTNTGDPAAPVSYVAAQAHSKEYYREGILSDLAAEADLARALEKWKVRHPDQPPQASLRPVRPEEALATERSDEYLVRQGVKTLTVGLNEDYPLDDRHVLRWRLSRADGGKVQADAAEVSGLALRTGREWQADFSGVEWRRGEYRVRVSLYASASGSDLAWKTVTFRFQPHAPTLVLRRDGKAALTTERKPLEVMEDRLTLQVVLEAPPGQEIDLRFAQFRNGQPQKEMPAARAHTGAGTFTQEFKLQEGLNRLAVRAVNKGALPSHEEEEAAVAEVWVSYKAPSELPPQFTELRLEPEPEVKRLEGKDVWIVNRPNARLAGKIAAEGVLVQAGWSTGAEPKSVLTAHASQTVEFAVDLALKAGELLPVRLRAQSKHSDESTTERWVVYYPLLPTVALAPLNSPDILADKIVLTGTVQAATTDPFAMSCRVTSAEGKVKSFQPAVDAKAGTWKVELSLFPGGNTVETLVANKWRGERATGSVLLLNYRRPPRITAIAEKVEAVETNKVRLALTVEGPADRPLTEIKVDGKHVEFQSGAPTTHEKNWVWKVELPEVFVTDGARNLQQVSVRAVTDEGESSEALVRVEHKKIPRPPVARFLSPAAADTARRPEYPVVFRIESEKPLERVEILRDGKPLYQADLKSVEREGTRHVLQGEALVKLANGVNTLELVAVNAEGRSPRAGAEVVVSYTEPAVLVSIDRVELISDKGDVEQVLKPVYHSNGDVSFPVVPRSLVWLVGQVRWSDPEAKALEDSGLEVVVKVRDCRQFPVALRPRGRGDEANKRPFRVPVVLNGDDNKIKVEVPNVGQQELSRHEFKLACAAPAKDQRLHVLIVGINVHDAADLKKRVLDALVVDAKDRPAGAQGAFSKNPPFQQCVLYHVLAGEVERGQVEAQLVEINREIKRLYAVTHQLNDVVLIYYQGEDVAGPGKKERWLKTSRNLQFPQAPPQTFAIPCHALPRVPGAQLLLLNVTGSPGAQAANSEWGGDPDTGLMRYALQDQREQVKADPVLLALLQEAMHKEGRLGEVVKYVNDLIGKQATKFSPLVVLDEDQANRRIAEPKR